MLILTRRTSESIIIGDDVKVTILGIKGHQVRLGIDAPKSTSVHREEIFKRISEEKNAPAEIEKNMGQFHKKEMNKHFNTD